MISATAWHHWLSRLGATLARAARNSRRGRRTAWLRNLANVERKPH